MSPPQKHTDGDRSSLRACADLSLARSGLWQNPFFEALRAARLSLADFRSAQEQFYFAVAFFSRPMAGLLARSPDYASRIDLLRNVVEEHGGFQLSSSHAETFLAFLQTLGSDPAQVRGQRPSPAVHAFNSVLYSACLLEELEVGIACVSVIEHAFARLSAEIGQAVVAQGWVPREKLLHYALHSELDLQHADELFRLLEPKWDCAEKRELIERGFALGAYAFDRLYRDLQGQVAWS